MTTGQPAEQLKQSAPVGSFFSSMQLRRLKSHTSTQPALSSETHLGAFLFLDLVSFTRLGEQLSEQGLKGAEVLSDVLQAYFRPILDTIRDHGGDVLFFAGDALGIIWLADDNDPAEASARAAQCALAVQQRIAKITSPLGQPLTFRASLGIGPVEAFEVGGVDDNWMQLVRGRAIDLACRADEQGSGGTVVMTEHCARHLAPFLPDISPIGIGFVRLNGIERPLPVRNSAENTLSAEQEQLLGKRLSEAVHRHLYYPSSAVAAEFRRITVLFADISDTSPETLHVAVRTAQQDVQHFDGVVYQLQEDDKGTGLVIVFGLPGSSHADDPVRALLLAQRIAASFEQLGISPRLGIATGTAFCGPLGTSDRQQYSILGSTVNLAARLMSIAKPGETFCDGQTRKQALNDFDFAKSGSTLPKGFKDTVPIYKPGARSERIVAHVDDIELVGRESEVADITAQIARATTSGTSNLLVIRADAGVGKSALLQKARAITAAQDLLAINGSTDPFETETAYFAFRNIARHWCGLDGIDDETAIIAQLEHTLADAPDMVPLIPLLGPVIGVDIPETDLTSGLRGQLRSENTQRVLLHIAAASFQKSPAVILIEDGHWMDGASWAFLTHLLDNISGLLVLLSTRALTEGAGARAPVLQDKRTQFIDLSPVSRAGTLDMIRQQLRVTEVSEQTLSLVFNRAEGNPLFVREILRNLIEAGALKVTNDRVELLKRQDDAEPVPDTLDGVITSRIDRLETDAQITIKAAAVLGRAFDADLLQAVHPLSLDPPLLDSQLAVLEENGFLLRNTGKDDYVFHHALTRDAAYNLLSFAQRESLHHKTALAMEVKHAGNTEQINARLGYHFRMAGIPEKAAPPLAAAGSTALDAYASSDAIELLTTALRLDEEHRGKDIGVDLTRTNWCRLIGQAYFNQDNQPEAANWYRRAIDEAGVAPRRPVLSIIPTLLRAIFRPSSLDVPRPNGLKDEDRDRITAGLTSARELGPIYLWESDLNKFALNAVNLVRMSSVVGPTSESANALATLAFMMSSAGLRKKSETVALQAVRMAEDFGDVPQLIGVQVVSGMVLAQNGSAGRALPLFEAAEGASGELIAGIWRHRCKYMLADALTWLGRYEEAHQLFLDTAVLSHSAEPHAVSTATAMAALNLLRLGRAQDALDLLEGPDGVAHALACGVPASPILCLGVMAEVRRALGQKEAALAAAAQAEQQATEKDDGTGYYSGIFGYSSILNVRLQTGELGGDDGAALDLKRVQKLTKVAPLGLPTQALWQGLWEVRQGRTDKAKKQFNIAISAATQANHPFELGRALVELSKLCDGDKKHELLRQATDVFERHNMSLELATIRTSFETQE